MHIALGSHLIAEDLNSMKDRISSFMQLFHCGRSTVDEWQRLT